ncbi:MAG: ARMT1-like domain-containing protein [Thermodesulfobacteriota bacterium]
MDASRDVLPKDLFETPEDPTQHAWYSSFYLENHIDYISYPDIVATPEKVNFMVVVPGRERYYPCSDHMFSAIMARKRPAFLQRRYDEVLDKLVALIDLRIEDPWEKEYLESLIRTKFSHETADGAMIPSRLEKRLIKIFLDRTMIEDPYREEKAAMNRRADTALSSQEFLNALNQPDQTMVDCRGRTLEDVRNTANRIQLTRLLALLSERAIWEEDLSGRTTEYYSAIMAKPLSGAGAAQLIRLLTPERSALGAYVAQPLRIFWLVDEAGQAVIDLFIVRFLAGLGHKVILAFKDKPLFTKVCFPDAMEDPTLKRLLSEAHFIKEKEIAKNHLVDLLKRDMHIMALSDGTMEELNLLLVNATFARMFKEADIVVARGRASRRRFFDTHFNFTQDILSIAREDSGEVTVEFKPRDPSVIKFSVRELEQKARNIIAQMENAKKQGMTVVFYSGIVGSIPGKIEMAKKIMSIFVTHLRDQSASTFVINPSEHFEQGLDADDLMYMWEIVQRSGLIDIWRFQSYDDIVTAFGLMGKKVPPEWVGKDATYSTGCTKEMKIALSVQDTNPEMQIIGPPREKFIRRAEYGIGSLFDRRLGSECA